jgi:hypothetical protein
MNVQMVLVDKILPKLRDEGHRVLVFSQFIRVAPLNLGPTSLCIIGAFIYERFLSFASSVFQLSNIWRALVALEAALHSRAVSARIDKEKCAHLDYLHSQVLDLLEDYMRWKGFPVERIDGRIRGAARQVSN